MCSSKVLIVIGLVSVFSSCCALPAEVTQPPQANDGNEGTVPYPEEDFEINWDEADYGEDDPFKPIIPLPGHLEKNFEDGTFENVTNPPFFNEGSGEDGNVTIVPFDQTSEDRIVRGTTAPYGLFDWQVHLRSDTLCGGTLISSRHILTAAHCNTKFRSTRVCAGSRFWSSCSKGQVRWVSYIYLHPRYDRNEDSNRAIGYDIAVHRVSSAFSLTSTVGVARLWTSFVGNNVRLTVAGWGATSPSPSASGSSILKMAGLVTKTCTYSIPNLPSRNSLLCYSPSSPNPGQHCYGDSGGFVGGSSRGRAVVVGVVSFGNCLTTMASTRVSYFTSFIRSACGNCQ